MVETWDVVFRDTSSFWVQFVFVPLVVAVGVTGNSITIFILTRKKLRLTSEVYLIALTLSDLLFLLFFFSVSWKHYECMKSFQIYWKYIPFGQWFTDALSSASVWLIVAFTIERYVAICHPLVIKSRSPNTTYRAKLLATSVYFICTILTIPVSFTWRAAMSNLMKGTNVQNFTVFDQEYTEIDKYDHLIYRWFSATVFVFLPMLILTVGNILLINAVRSSQKLRQNLVSCHAHLGQVQKIQREDRITITLIVIIVAFIICQLPTTIFLIYTSMHTPSKDSVEENVLLGLGNFANLLIAINAECNFILYIATSEKYRKSFIQILWLDSMFQRWYHRKDEEVTAEDVLIVNAVEEKFSVRTQYNKTGEGGSIFAKEYHEMFELPQRSLVIMRKCLSCEPISGGPKFSSSGSPGPTSL